METTKINLNAAIEKRIKEVIAVREELHREYPEMAEDDEFAIPSADKKFWRKTRGFEYRELKVPAEYFDIADKLISFVSDGDWRLDFEGTKEYIFVSVWAPKNGEYKEDSDALIEVASSINIEFYDSDLITLQRELIEIAGFYLRDDSKTKRNDGKVGKGWDSW